MPKVITAREAEELLRKGEQPPAGSILTPSARDVLGGGSLQPAFKGTGAAKPAAPATPSPLKGMFQTSFSHWLDSRFSDTSIGMRAS